VTGQFQVSQCSVAGERIFGVAQEALRSAPIPGDADNAADRAAIAADQIRVFGPGEVCLLRVASAVTAGAYLKTDANGLAVATTTANDIYGAIALEPQATANGLVRAFVQSGKI
jgi:hypothetical protein